MNRKARINLATSEKISPLAERLRQAGLRPTMGRMDVATAMTQIGEGYHYPEDILRELLRQGWQGSVTTIYRVFADFTVINFVQRSFDADGKTKYRLTHYGKSAEEICLVCKNTGRRILIQDKVLRSQLDHLAHLHGMETSPLALLVHVDNVPKSEDSQFN
ncbi:transcriptional repressor [Undibacterium sp. Tian12W]|uniref:transcriptional repressor n=1 Tax=Undibacterium sp. Tian12W TaxID=3413054 RepID=UPI003BF32EB9